MGTEIDEKSREFAIRNIKQNGLDSRIKVIGVESHSKMLIPSNELEKLGQYGLLGRLT